MNIKYLLQALLAFVSSLWLTCFADTDASAATPATGSAIQEQGAVLQMFLGLFAVLLLIFALAWLVRKMGPGGFMASPHIKILASTALGPRERLVMVEAGKQQLLLGVSQGGINTLHVFEQPVIDSTEAVSSSDFAKKIASLMQPKNAPAFGGQPPADQLPTKKERQS